MGDQTLIRYTNVIDPQFSKLIKNAPKLQSLTLNKIRGIPSSIAIASAITAYARIKMSNYINMNDCIYTDTDSLVVQNPLPDNLIGEELGQFKLEYVIKKGIFISPKVYVLKYIKNNTLMETTVCKGLGKDLTFNDFEKLLAGENVIKMKKYFVPRLDLGTVEIIEKLYTIRGVKPND
ncbi:hypothetical protein BB558_003645 [Smittium angustum]|uniref:Uncharacterized protein n=1 Tax=Smittium angustum TaxID=133377 RepID=A0A2U1J5E6_SMIAN|nr:hypothetical protein BB558_003645 [Smittium angustum]